MSKILDQIEKKYIFTDDVQALVGTEIRLRRQGKSRTLEDTASETCSISYLSKIETNTIKANPELLEELCKQFKVTQSNLKSINNSLSIYENLLKAEFFNDTSLLEKCFKSIEGLRNYRAILIRFFYFVSINNLSRARSIYKDLNKLIKSMQLNDLIIFAYAEALFRYKLNEINVSYELLLGLQSMWVPFKYVDCLVLELKSKILFTTNSNLFLEHIDKLKDLYIKNQAYNKLEKINEVVKLFYAKNGYYYLLKLDESNENDHDLLLYKELFNEEELVYRSGYSNFAKLLYLVNVDKDEFYALYDKVQCLITPCQRVILDILSYQDSSEEFYKDMIDRFYPEALAYQDDIVISFVENKLVDLLIERKRYRRIVEIFKSKSKIRKDSSILC